MGQMCGVLDSFEPSPSGPAARKPNVWGSTAVVIASNSLVSCKEMSTTDRPLARTMNGGRVVFATDDWFAVAENMLKAAEPEWREGVFTECGKWMDGWETRRKRTPGHDWAIIKLCFPGRIKGVYVDTAYFTGNFAPRISLQAARLTLEEEILLPPRVCSLGSAATTDMMKQVERLQSHKWREIVAMTSLKAGHADTRHHYIHTKHDSEVWTHVRLNIYPDGGIARLRLYGEVHADWDHREHAQLVDLICMENGGVCTGYSNAHYGHPRNIIRPGRGLNMADGWETARRLDRPCVLEENENGILQVPGSEWAVFQLSHPGTIENVEVDTLHFKGNYPDSVWIEGSLETDSCWKTLLPVMKLSPHKLHRFTHKNLHHEGPFKHIRVNIAPDGGISRLRLWGHRCCREEEQHTDLLTFNDIHT